MTKYDYLIVGAGLFGAVFAYEAKKTEKSVSSLIRENMSAEISIVKI